VVDIVCGVGSNRRGGSHPSIVIAVFERFRFALAGLLLCHSFF
jgi:hypothetical protein